MDWTTKSEENHRSQPDVRLNELGGLAARLLAIGKDCAVHWKEPFKSIDHAMLLYGDDGLPQGD